MKPNKYIFSLLLLLTFGYLWILGSARYDLGGERFDKQILGTVVHQQQLAMQFYCTGVIKAAQDTWLVSRLENYNKKSDFIVPLNNVNLNELLYGEKKEEMNVSILNPYSARKSDMTILSRLNESGQFEQIASVNGEACLLSNPESSTLILITELDQPKKQNDATNSKSRVVFRSGDRGKTWYWSADDFLPSTQGYSLIYNRTNIFTYGNSNVWVVDDNAGNNIYYSEDNGLTLKDTINIQSLLISESLIERSDSNTVVKKYVAQFDKNRATVWISQDYYTKAIVQADLHRIDNKWQLENISRQNGMVISALYQKGNTVFSIMNTSDEKIEISRYDLDSKKWIITGELPNVFSPLDSRSHLRDLWVGEDILVAKVSGDHPVPRWLFPWYSNEIFGSGTFYSKNAGASWRKLSMDKYSKVIGIEGNKAIWEPSEYNNKNIYFYQIHSE